MKKATHEGFRASGQSVWGETIASLGLTCYLKQQCGMNLVLDGCPHAHGKVSNGKVSGTLKTEFRVLSTFSGISA